MASITLYHITKESKNFKSILKRLEKGEDVTQKKDKYSLVCFSSFRGSLAYAAIQMRNKVSEQWRRNFHKDLFLKDRALNESSEKWLRIILKAKEEDFKYPYWQFGSESLVPFYLVCKYQKQISHALKTSTRKVPIINLKEEGIENASIIGIHAFSLTENRFSVYYRYNGYTFLSPSFLEREQATLLGDLVKWYAHEDKTFLDEYNMILHSIVKRQLAVIETGDALFPAFVINPAENPLHYSGGPVPQLRQITRLNGSLLPTAKEIPSLINKDVSRDVIFNQLRTPEALHKPIWISKFISSTPISSYKPTREKLKYNIYHRRKTWFQVIAQMMKLSSKSR